MRFCGTWGGSSSRGFWVYLGLVIALVLVIVGTALMFSIRDQLAANISEKHNQYDWDGAAFWIAWLFAFFAIFFRSTMSAVLGGGITVGFSLYLTGNLFSWAEVNMCRVQDEKNHSKSSVLQRCAAGGILAYTGIVLALLVAFSPYSFSVRVVYPVELKKRLCSLSCYRQSLLRSLVISL